MICIRPVVYYFALILLIFKVGFLYGQAPNISYPVPQKYIYTSGTAIPALIPSNKGGAVPPNNYGEVSSFAGTGSAGAVDGTGSGASISAPLGLAIDKNGNIYLADYNNCVIRKITPGGKVTTLAGKAGVKGATDGNGVSASFSNPAGVAVDDAGNIYVADSFNYTIRKVEPDGTVSTIAGLAGTRGTTDAKGALARFNSPMGIAVDNLGFLYVTDSDNNMIRKIAPNGDVSTLAGAQIPGTTDGQGTSARFSEPIGIALDAQNNIYVTDANNNLVRKITPGGLVSTLAGSGVTGSDDGGGIAASFNRPLGIAINSDGSFYIADEKNNLIRRMTADGAVITTAGSGVGGSNNGIGVNATFGYPGSVVADDKGNIYVGDISTFIIRKISITGYTINKALPAGLTFDGRTGTISGTPTAASLPTDYTITAYNTNGSSSAIINITINDNSIPGAPPKISYSTPPVYHLNKTITPLMPQNTGGSVPAIPYGQVSTFAGNGSQGATNGPVLTASFTNPAGIAVDIAGNMYIADYGFDLIRKISGGIVGTLAGSSSQGSGNGQGTQASFNNPAGLAIDALGNIYVADTYNNLIRKITPGGLVSTFAGNGIASSGDGQGTAAYFNNPYGLTIDAGGNLYVSEFIGQVIRKIDKNGYVSTLAGLATNGGSKDGLGSAARFSGPANLTIDAAGNLYVAEVGNNKIRKITPNGLVSTFAGTGAQGSLNGARATATFYAPYGITSDASGNLYVADSYNNIIRKIAADGTVTTLAGSGAFGAANGEPAAASFRKPYSLAADFAGNLYVADFSNYIIRKIAITGYTIDKQLPAGLSFDTATGIISGTPTARSPATDYIVTAINSYGSSIAHVTIQVVRDNNNLPLPPKFAYQTPNNYKVGALISPLIPTQFAGGGAIPANAYGRVTTFASNRANGDIGNFNSLGIPVSFPGPAGLAFDKKGNLFVAEIDNSSITQITPAGAVVTLAGGSRGYANGQGSVGRFDGPYDITIDLTGNLFVADEGNQRIRRVTPGGVANVWAGNGTMGTTNGPTSSASFNNPVSIVRDVADNIYVADRESSIIRKIDLVNQVSDFTSLAVYDGNAAKSALTYLAIDASDNLYASDNNRVVKITQDGVKTVIAGNGTPGFADGRGIAAIFNRLEGLAVDAIGNVYAADADNNRIRKIAPDETVTTLAGSGDGNFADGIGAEAKFFTPHGLKIDNTGEFLYAADGGNKYLRKIAITGYVIDKALPAGLVFDATTGTISGTPSAVSPAADYTITGYNIGGSWAFVINLEVTAEQTIAFAPLPGKTQCDADFDPGATSNLSITYTSSNTAVATIVGGKIHVVGAGTTTITASDGNSTADETLTVAALVTPSISIIPNLQDNCQGSPVTYAAVAINGGNSPFYQWQVNGQNTGTNDPEFTSSSLNDHDKITCILTSNAACTTTATATSNIAEFTVDPPVTTSITITSTATGPICAGIPVTFIANPVTNDTDPIYQWQVNGINDGTNSPVFTSTSLADGDIVTCIVTSNIKCLVNPTATSNAIMTTLAPANTCIIIVPNAFTPNGDGINDFWNIIALQAHTDCAVSVFTRYGALVYNSVGYASPWDGTRNGKALPVGTYYYIIDLKSGKKQLSGFVTILR